MKKLSGNKMMQVGMERPARLDQLTSLRFFAAMMIVLHHSQHYFGVNSAGVNLGQGVSFFFVLSGFILTYVYPSLDSSHAVLTFLRARVARIWPAYVFGFLFAFWLVPFEWRSATAVANLLMVQAWIPVSQFYFSYNAASWSVSTEFFFYLIFPLLIYRWQETWLIKLIVSLLILLVLFLVSNNLNLPPYGDPAIPGNGLWVTEHGLIYINPLSRVFEFVVGMVVATLSRQGKKLGFAPASVIEVFAVALCVISVYFGSHIVAVVQGTWLGAAGRQWAIHSGSVFAFAVLIGVMARGEGGISRFLSLRPFVFLGEVSFSLYLLHQTMLTVIQRASLFQQLPGWVSWTIFFVVTLGLSCIVWLTIEIPGRRLFNGGGISHGTKFMADFLSGNLFRTSSHASWAEGAVRVIASVCAIYAAYIALRYATQSPLDEYAFRQAQTALSAYWLMLNGFSISYETPVAGPAWSIPFEFPIYQYMVAIVAKTTGVSLDAVGRLLSFVFLILCLVPVGSIIRLLRLPRSVFYSFVAVLFSSPMYLYWGRSFMIETAALFFTVVAIRYFCEMLVDGYPRRSVWLYLIFMSLGLLQKATTALPALLILSVAFAVVEGKRSGSVRQLLLRSQFWKGAIYFAVPLVIAVAWTGYTDYVKSFNPLGVQLTSDALNKWNWGTLQQRFSGDLYIKVLWGRILVNNLAGAFGLGLILFGMLSKCELRTKLVVAGSVLAGVLPLFLFSNLHIVHSYYQTANLIYLIFAVAVVLGAVLGPLLGARVLVSSLTLIVGSNLIAFYGGYLPQAKAVFSNSNSREYSIGTILKREVPVGKQFVAFGNDWSSTIGYISQRKSFNVPGWFRLFGEVSEHPERFVDEAQLGAVVNCASQKPGLPRLLEWSSGERGWKIGEAHGCYVVTPEKVPALEVPVQHVQCEGSIDRAVLERRDGAKVISLAGWATMAGGRGVPDDAFFTLERQDRKPVYLEALKVPRADVNAHLGISEYIDAGLSRIAVADLEPGAYSVGVTQEKDGKLETCQFRGQLVVDGSI